MNGYESYHPAVQFLYYALAVGFSMVSMHPVVIAASIIGGMLLFSIRNTPRKIVEELFFFFCLFFMLAVMNPIFIHSGETILFFMNDNSDYRQIPVSVWKNHSKDGTDPVYGIPVYSTV